VEGPGFRPDWDRWKGEGPVRREGRRCRIMALEDGLASRTG
jgi:hypothetical protein